MTPTNSLKTLFLAMLAIPSFGVFAAAPKTWNIKLRAAYLETADESDAFSALGINFAEGAVSVEDKWIPEIDITYAFTKNLLAEAALTIPQKHDVYLAGVGKIGSLEHIPPTLSLVYEFNTQSALTPYLSGGLNFTWITNKRLKVANIDLDLDDYSIGLALGAGVAYDINERWNLDASLKWIDLDSDITAGGTKLTKASLDPWLFSFGANYRF